MTDTDANIYSEPSEIWADLPGYQGSYEVSDRGRIRSLTRRVPRRGGTTAIRQGRLLRPSLSGHSTPQFTANRDGVQERIFVHHAVLAAFVGPKPEGMIAMHRNGDPTDNRLVNLRYGTRAEVSLGARQRGTMRGLSITHCPRGHELIEPNLSPSHAERGHRLCRACHGAQTKINYHKLDRGRLQEISDQHYERIMAGQTPARKATHCNRGHRLEHPNLVPSSWRKRRQRSCLSCNRARSYLTNYPDDKTPENLQRLADQYYDELAMGQP